MMNVEILLLVLGVSFVFWSMIVWLYHYHLRNFTPLLGLLTQVQILLFSSKFLRTAQLINLGDFSDYMVYMEPDGRWAVQFYDLYCRPTRCPDARWATEEQARRIASKYFKIKTLTSTIPEVSPVKPATTGRALIPTSVYDEDRRSRASYGFTYKTFDQKWADGIIRFAPEYAEVIAKETKDAEKAA